MINFCSAPGLHLTDQISCYCERGSNPDFWAEPLNSLSNIAFLIAAYSSWRPVKLAEFQSRQIEISCLIGLTVIVGVGSFLFHTMATVWSALTDIIPIGVLILFYLFLALRLYFRASALLSVLGATCIVAIMFSLPPLLNGSLLYVPPILAVNLIGLYLIRHGVPGAGYAICGALVFLPSIIFRTIDRYPLFCSEMVSGTHFLWHGLNALGIYLLIRAMIEFRRYQETS